MRRSLTSYNGSVAGLRSRLARERQSGNAKVVDLRAYAQRRQTVTFRHQILNYRTPGNGGDVA